MGGGESYFRYGVCLWLGLACTSIHFLYYLAATGGGVGVVGVVGSYNNGAWQQQQQQQRQRQQQKQQQQRFASFSGDGDDDDDASEDPNNNKNSTTTTTKHRNRSSSTYDTNTSVSADGIIIDNNGGIGKEETNLSPPTASSISSFEEFRFPSARERVEYYMGDWFHNNNNNNDTNRTTAALLVQRGLCRRVPFYDASNGLRWNNIPYIFDKRILLLNKNKKWFIRHFPTLKAEARSFYFRDAWDNVFRPYYDRSGGDVDGVDLRVAMMFGDTKGAPPFPIVIKTRHSPLGFAAANSKTSAATDTPTTTGGTMTPILALLTEERHYGGLKESKMLQAVPWEQKKNILLWRGASTGERIRVIQKYANHSSNNNSSNQNNTLMNLGFTKLMYRAKDNPDNVCLLRDPMTLAEQMQFKYLLSLEGTT